MSKRIIGAGVAAAILIGGTIFGLISMERIKPGYVGVVYSMNGGIQDEVITQGWKFIGPGKKVTQYSIATEQLYLSADEKEGSKDNDSFDVMCKDGKLNVDLEMSYSFDAEKVPDVFTRYRGMDGQDVIDNIVRGKIKTYVNEVTSQFTVLEAHMEKKGELNRAITEHLKNMLAEFGVTVESANITRTQPDAAVEAAIVERSKAAQELEAEKQRQEKAKLEAETKKISAQGEADAALIKAQGEAAANEALQKSITDELIRMTEAEARVKHGWITVTGADTIVTQAK